MKWLVFLLVALVPPLAAEPRSEDLVDAAVEGVFEPLFNNFYRSSERLQHSLAQQCEGEEVRAAFIAAVKDYSAIEYFRIGAMNSENRAERLFFWPDRKGTGQKQLRRLLADPARVNIDSSAIANKSVALQGLPALERILYAKGAVIPEANCAVARAIAENIHRVASQVHSDWTDKSGVGQMLRHPESGSLYRTHKESVSALLTLVESGLKQISDKKIKLLRKGLIQQSRIPKNMLLWRSAKTFDNLQGNLLGLRRLMLDSGLADAASAKKLLEFEFSNATRMVDAVDQSLQQMQVETALERLEALNYILINLDDIVSNSVAMRLGVVTGFNASDGD